MGLFNLRDALEDIKTRTIANLKIATEHDVSSMSLPEVDAILSRAVDAVSHDFSNITKDDILDIYRSLLKGVMTNPETIHPAFMTKILDSITSAFDAAVDDTSGNVDYLGLDGLRERRQILETYAFLLTWSVLGVEKYKGLTGSAFAAPKPGRVRGAKAAMEARAKKTGEWTWVEQTLALVVKMLKIRSQRIWVTSVDRDTVVEALMGPIYRIMENDAYMKAEGIRANVHQAICLAVKHHNHGMSAQGKLIQILGYSDGDGLADQVADLLAALANDYDHIALAEEFLREVADKTWTSTDSTGPKSFSRCLVRLGEVAPHLVLKELSALQNHLDNDAYQMRSGIVEVFGLLIRDQISQRESAEDKDHVDNTVNGLYDALLERLLDTSSYVRSRVFQVVIKVLEMDGSGRYNRQRTKVALKCGHALVDKMATVRKYALACLQVLLQTHTIESVKDGHKYTDLPREHYEEQYEQFCASEKAHKAELVAILKENAANGFVRPEAKEAQTAAQKKTKTLQKPKWKKRRSEDANGIDLDGEDGRAEGSDDNGDGARIISTLKEATDGDFTSLNLSGLTVAQQERVNLAIERIESAEKYRKIYAVSLQFIGAIETAMQTAFTLLGSKHKAEVLEAMELFGVAYMYKISIAKEGMRKMIHLVWQKDHNAPPTITGEEVDSTKGVRTKLIAIYESIYFRPQKLIEQSQVAKEIAKQLIVLTYSLSLSELTSLEELLQQMMNEDRVHSEVIETLWLVFEDRRALPPVQRRGAIILLGMFALSKPSVVREKQSILLKIGLGKHGKSDLKLAKYTCIALQRMTDPKKKSNGSFENSRQRYPMSNPIFHRLLDVLEASTRDRAWFAFAEQALNALYALAERPEVVAERLIRDLTRRAFTSTPMPAAGVHGSAQPPLPQPGRKNEKSQERYPGAMETNDDEETIKANALKGGEKGKGDGAAIPQPQAAPDPSQASAVPESDAGDAFGLSQMFFVVGHVAMKHIVHLELIELEIKRRKQKQETAAKQGANGREKEDEIELVVDNAGDDIGELIKHVREEELLFGEKSLLNVYGPLLVHVCGSPQIYKDATLRSAATLSFAKFLCVSGKFCEQHHMLLFKIFEMSRDPNIRANIVIGIGDLAVSFATIIDERLNNLYMGLRADELIVKKNTLMVLTHLILNGMIKVKGQLAEMAKCIEDKEESVSDLAKLFFGELSTKDDYIYTNFPDMISHLSMGKFAVSEEAFQNIMRYIFTFIEKECQAENIIEKLCQRFKLAPESRQWRDIAFCLSLLTFRSEKSLKKLIEGLPHYKDKLHDEGVYTRFVEILGKAKLAKKNETEIVEFERILDDNRQKGEEDQEFEKQIERTKAKAKKWATRREKAANAAPAQRPTRTKKKAAAVVEKDDMCEDD